MRVSEIKYNTNFQNILISPHTHFIVLWCTCTERRCIFMDFTTRVNNTNARARIILLFHIFFFL